MMKLNVCRRVTDDPGCLSLPILILVERIVGRESFEPACRPPSLPIFVERIVVRQGRSPASGGGAYLYLSH